MHSSTIAVVCPGIPDPSSRCALVPKQPRQLLSLVIHRTAKLAKGCNGVGRTLRKDNMGEADLQLLSGPGILGRPGNERTLRGQGMR